MKARIPSSAQSPHVTRCGDVVPRRVSRTYDAEPNTDKAGREKDETGIEHASSLPVCGPGPRNVRRRSRVEVSRFAML